MKNQLKILAVAENQQEMANLIPVYKNFASLSLPFDVLFEFLCLDPIFHQKVEDVLLHHHAPYKTFHPKQRLNRSIYYYNKITQLYFSISNFDSLREIMDGYDALICGAVGIPQRILAIHAVKQGKPTFQIIGGRLSASIAQSVVNKLLLGLYRCFPTWSHLLPGGYLAGSVLMRDIFCIGLADKNVLAQTEIKAHLHATGIPRFAYLFAHNLAIPKVESFLHILFLPASFKWHNMIESHHRQTELLNNLISQVIQPNANYQLSIKIHPRENPEDYQWLEGKERVSVVTGNLVDAFEQAHIVTAVASTGIMEAVKSNRLAAFLIADFDNDKAVQNLSNEMPFIPALKTYNDIAQYLAQIQDETEYQNRLLAQQEAVDYYVSNTTANASTIISQTILEALINKK